MARIGGPPSRCGACGAFGRAADGPQERCEVCGAALAPRPFFDTGELSGPGAPLVAALPPVPAICGTAMLSIARIGELRRFCERAQIDAVAGPRGLVVRIVLPEAPDPDLSVHESARLSLPARLGVSVRPSGAPFRGGCDAFLDVHVGRVEVTVGREMPAATG